MLDQGVNQKKPPDPYVLVLERMNRLELICAPQPPKRREDTPSRCRCTILARDSGSEEASNPNRTYVTADARRPKSGRRFPTPYNKNTGCYHEDHQ